MSMYWSGYDALGCLIKGNDLDYFKEQYLKYCIENTSDFNNMDHDDQIELLDEYICTNDCYELPIDGCGYREEAEGAYICHVSTGYFERIEEPFIIVEAEKQPYTYGIFNRGFYESYEELSNEFKNKIAKFLPKDFDFESNIGDISYAYYA